MLNRLRREERGVALITAMLVSVVVFSFGLVAVELSQHNSVQSAFDRKRVQAIHAAEAGLDAYLAALPQTPPSTLQCAVGPRSVPMSPGAEYRVLVRFYPTYPGIVGQEMACPINPNNPPAGAVIFSTGSATSATAENSVSRTMQTEVKLNQVLGGLDKAIFSDTGLNITQNLTVNGNTGNDGTLYTNGSFTCANSTLDYGTVEAPRGGAELRNNCTIQEDLHVRDNIRMIEQSRVGHDAISANGSITLENSARIDNNARAGTTCTGCNPGRVLGTVTTNSPSSGPLHQAFPTVEYVPSAWASAGYAGTGTTYSSCTDARNAVSTATVKTVIRVTGNCSLEFSQLSTVSLRGDMALIVDGPTAGSGACPAPPNPSTCAISLRNQTRFQSADGQTKTLYLIVPKSSATPCNANGGDNILVENNTANFINVRLFIYSPCVVNMANRSDMAGQIYGGTVNISQQFTFAYRPISVPGAGRVTGFASDIAYLREVTNP